MLQLTISERIYAIALLNQFKGSLDVLVDMLEDIKKFKVDEEDWAKANKQVIEGTNQEGQPITSWTWDDEKGGEKEIEIEKTVKDYLIGKIKEANDKGEFTLQDKAAITLSKKLESK